MKKKDLAIIVTASFLLGLETATFARAHCQHDHHSALVAADLLMDC